MASGASCCFALSISNHSAPYHHLQLFNASFSFPACRSRTLCFSNSNDNSNYKKESSSSSSSVSVGAALPIVSWSRRKQHVLTILALTVLSTNNYSSLLNIIIPKTLLAVETEELERYTDAKEGFTLLRPSSYLKVDKAGAIVLFEEMNKGSNNIGVVVNPVRLTSLGEFGTPQFVADKLIQAEKRKESTKDAAVIGVAERSGNRGLQVYEFEYKVDSTRGGMKRIFSAAFVAFKKLYLLNITHSDKPENPLDTRTRMMLEEVLHSFDVAYMT